MENIVRWEKIRRFQDICHEDTHKTYTALSGDQITQSKFWEKLQMHNKRRNDLVHPVDPLATRRRLPSQGEAEESFQAVEAYIQHVTQILGSI